MITFIIISSTAVAMVAGSGSYAPDGENNSVENNNQHNHERRQHNNSLEIAATGRGGEDEGAVTLNDGRPLSFGHLLFTFRCTTGFLRAKTRARKDECDQRRSIVASSFYSQTGGNI